MLCRYQESEPPFIPASGGIVQVSAVSFQGPLLRKQGYFHSHLFLTYKSLPSTIGILESKARDKETSQSFLSQKAKWFRKQKTKLNSELQSSFLHSHEYIVIFMINFKILLREKNSPYYKCNRIPINMMHDLLTHTPNWMPETLLSHKYLSLNFCKYLSYWIKMTTSNSNSITVKSDTNWNVGASWVLKFAKHNYTDSYIFNIT